MNTYLITIIFRIIKLIWVFPTYIVTQFQVFPINMSVLMVWPCRNVYRFVGMRWNWSTSFGAVSSHAKWRERWQKKELSFKTLAPNVSLDEMHIFVENTSLVPSSKRKSYPNPTYIVHCSVSAIPLRAAHLRNVAELGIAFRRADLRTYGNYEEFY